MKQFIRFLFFMGLYISCNLVWADRIGGAPRADFSSDELTVPCVQVTNSDDVALNNKFFDIILERRGNSFNYEVIFAESEDQVHCQRVDDFAKFEDDDFDDDDSTDDSPDGDSSDDDSNSGADAAKILVSCEKRTNRSKISVNGKNLALGDYSSIVTSGDNSASSLVKSAVGDEIEFDYDSAADDVAEGATEISADFIQDGTVDAEFRDSNSDTVVSVKNVVCETRD